MKSNIITVITLLSVILLSGPEYCHAQGVGQLPLPTLPVNLTAPKERAAYILTHFWDSMDFRDTLLSRNSDFMEQNFVNFASLFPHADTPAISRAVRNMLDRATADERAQELLAQTAEKYLFETESPMFDENHYLLFLEEAIRTETSNDTGKIRYRHQLEMLRKNRPGTRAADFRYTDTGGKSRRLYKTKADSLLLLFYDPDCPKCLHTIKKLQNSPVITRLVSDGKLTVLAIYAGDDDMLRETSLPDMPSQWKAGTDSGCIAGRESYWLISMPSIYLLDRNKTVLLKNPPVDFLEAYIDSRTFPVAPRGRNL